MSALRPIYDPVLGFGQLRKAVAPLSCSGTNMDDASSLRQSSDKLIFRAHFW